MKNLSLSVVIPNYNGAHFLPDCLKSIITASKNQLLNLEIIIVDNGSTDDSLLQIKKLNHSLKIENWHLKIIQNTSNLGFASAVNQGIQAAEGDSVMIINNDLTLHPQWFAQMIPVILQNKDPKVTTFFGLVLNKDGTKIESEGLEFFYRGKALNTNNGHPYLSSNPYTLRPYLIWGASASVVIYHKQTIQAIGLFDPDFFAYEEDVDLALRLRKLGYLTLYIPTAISYHLGGGTSRLMGNFRHRMDAKNWIYIILKNYSLSEFLKNLPQIVEERLRNLSGLIKNTPLPLVPYSIIRTYGQIILNLPNIQNKRKAIQKLLKSTKV